jgi:3-hydroxypropanoate dehydrogenase
MNVTTEQLFTEARTPNGFFADPVPESKLRAIYDLMKFGPTSANCSPARILFVSTPEAKARLVPHMDAGNQAKTLAAPVTAIIGMDMVFYEKLPQLFPHTDARSWFAGKPAVIEATAFRNGSLQGAYFMLAARALGVDCGPMSGFNSDKVDAEFWAGTPVRTNFICNLGKGDPATIFPRSPRLAFEEACRMM